MRLRDTEVQANHPDNLDYILWADADVAGAKHASKIFDTDGN